MKKEEQTWVDDHFRRHEADIPVTFDPKHWEQLAAALNQAARPEGLVPPPSPTRRKPSGKIKGWWVSGVWVLLMLSSAWVLWQRSHVAAPVVPVESGSTVEKSEPTAPAPPVSAPPASSVSGAAEKAGTRQTEHRAAESVLENSVDEPEPQTPTPKNEMLPAVDSLLRQPAAPVNTPADTTSTGKKKKKHLFW